jgi:hypothetical protein
MTPPEETPPSGSAETRQSELGEPRQVQAGQQPHDDRLPPDLDVRQRSLSTVRKPAGPPPKNLRDRAEAAVPESTQEPSDPELDGM